MTDVGILTSDGEETNQYYGWKATAEYVAGNELSDFRAKEGVHLRRHAKYIRRKEQVAKWDIDALKGPTDIYTHRGPFQEWLWQIGKPEDKKWICREGQNAAHVIRCRRGIGD